MILNYKYRLYPTKEQENKLNQQFFISNQAWNHSLNIKIKNLKRKNGFATTKIIEKSIKNHFIKRKLKGHSGIIQMY